MPSFARMCSPWHSRLFMTVNAFLIMITLINGDELCFHNVFQMNGSYPFGWRSLFVAPTLCPTGFSSNGDGNCEPIKVIMDKNAQIKFILQRLNDKYSKVIQKTA